MTGTILPLVAGFRDAETHAKRADMLLRMPLWIVWREHEALSATCRATGLNAGTEYCTALFSALSSVRLPSGALPADLSRHIGELETVLQDIARQGRAVTAADGECRRVIASGSKEPNGDALTAAGHCDCPPTWAARDACPAWRFKT